MKVAIDCRKWFDFGVGTYVRGLVNGLAQLPDDGTRYYLLGPPDLGTRTPAGMTPVVVNAPNYSIAEWFEVGAVVERIGADLYHSPHFVLPATRCPSVVTLHDVILFNHPPRNPVKFAYVAALTARAARTAKHIMVDTRAAGDAIAAIFDCSRGNMTVAHLAVDDRFLAPAAARDSGYFLFVGNDMPHKGVDVLIAAFSEYRKRSGNARLKLTGGKFGRYEGTPGIELTGFVPDDELPSLYAGATALVLPSREEGFGLPVLEAMAVGTPVIASTAAALVEIAGGAALHVPVGDAEALSAALERIDRDASLRAELAHAGSVRVREFSWARCAEITRGVYRSLYR